MKCLLKIICKPESDKLGVHLVKEVDLPVIFLGLRVHIAWFAAVVQHVSYDVGDDQLRAYLGIHATLPVSDFLALGFVEVDEFGVVP